MTDWKLRFFVIGAIAIAASLGYAVGRHISPTGNHYTFEHRTDGIYRYDRTTGEIDILQQDKIGWQRIVVAAPSSYSRKAD